MGWLGCGGSVPTVPTVLAAVIATSTCAAQTPAFIVPVRCGLEPDGNCYIQQFVDHDPGPGAHDFACLNLTYDGHTGTDIAVRTIAAMRTGVPVVAAAAGTVIAARDGMADIDVRTLGGPEALDGKDAGNGVVIDHGGGWETQYSHLRKGSVSVRTGQRVEAGDVLGLIGMSGRAAFPHVDFTVRHDKKVVDPYLGLGISPICRSPTPAWVVPIAGSLWARDAQPAVAYRPSGHVVAGFAGEAADRAKALAGAYVSPPGPAAPALIFFVEIFGVRAGDRQEIEIRAPDGSVWVDSADVLSKDQARRFRFVGRKRPPGGWPRGVFTGTYRLIRDAQAVVTIERTWSAETP